MLTRKALLNIIWDEEQIIDFLDYMIWKITERKIIYKLVKMRRRKSEVRRVEKKNGKKIYYGSNYDDYIRKTYGIEKDLFIHTLFCEEFGESWFNKWLVSAYTKFRPIYFEHFYDDVKEIIESCKEKGFLKESLHHNGKTYLKEKLDGRKLLSRLFFPKKLLEYEPLRDLIAKVLKSN